MAAARWLEVHLIAKEIFEREPGLTKERLAEEIARRFGLTSGRSVHHAEDFSIRFVKAIGPSRSNSVVSLKTLRDSTPFLVCVLRPSGVETLLANSTFIEKASHSSQGLSLDKIVGTFVLSNISREHDGIRNIPDNFERLFEIHRGHTWEQNLARIVECTRGILPRGGGFHGSAEERRLILQAADVAHRIAESGAALPIERELCARVEQQREAILREGSQPSSKVRGDAIEALITGQRPSHELEDLSFPLDDGLRLLVDIKTKLLHRSSRPKLYDVDKLLHALSDGRTAVALFIIGIDVDRRQVACRLIDVLDRAVLNAIRRDPRWSGRASRGST
ncbi:MAG TPA: hypothetical protein VLS89_19435, partial [Candidatus Nanopelagicales bacterium]|nr:hypothetical protein [Candidatus Nanopelagicales bacterium]